MSTSDLDGVTAINLGKISRIEQVCRQGGTCPPEDALFLIAEIQNLLDQIDQPRKCICAPGTRGKSTCGIICPVLDHAWEGGRREIIGREKILAFEKANKRRVELVLASFDVGLAEEEVAELEALEEECSDLMDDIYPIPYDGLKTVLTLTEELERLSAKLHAVASDWEENDVWEDGFDAGYDAGREDGSWGEGYEAGWEDCVEELGGSDFQLDPDGE